jgi:hypothetical protein
MESKARLRLAKPTPDQETDELLRGYKNLCHIIDTLPADTPTFERNRQLANKDFMQMELFRKGIPQGSITYLL